jgi:predicted nuclease with TOPRIM domain
MSKSDAPTGRFRSATEFPKTIRTLDRVEAETLYEEMRDCLIFTNRSRSQLVRRNEEHKAKTGLLKEDVQRLQGMIRQLTSEKQQIAQDNQDIIQALEVEMTTMAAHLDELAFAFGDMDNLETAGQMQQDLWLRPCVFSGF